MSLVADPSVFSEAVVMCAAGVSLACWLASTGVETASAAEGFEAIEALDFGSEDRKYVQRVASSRNEALLFLSGNVLEYSESVQSEVFFATLVLPGVAFRSGL